MAPISVRLRNTLRKATMAVSLAYYRHYWGMDIGEGARISHKAILDKIPPVYAPFVVYLGFACEQPALDRANSFYAAPEHSAPGMDVELKKMLEAGGDCVKLRAREGPAVARFLTQMAQGSGGAAPAAATRAPQAR